MELVGKVCEEVGTVREFTCLGDRESVGGRCTAAVTVRTRCGKAKFSECGKILCGKRFLQDRKVLLT